FVLVRAPEEALRLTVGVVAVVLASAIAAGMRITAHGTATEVAVGGAAGVLSTSTGMSGPPVVAYLAGRGDERDEFRAVLTMYFMIGSITAVALFFAAGVVTKDALLLALAGLPAVYAGSVLGNWLASRIDAILFRRIVIALLLATALSGVGFSISRLVA
ncbi:MAG: sulfite exporter TauE/SafE family protein, partial [Chloroflexi bacterium]|nr:sulfite exporter TauE/SafE family protein [Chloroflexota bacterium]